MNFLYIDPGTGSMLFTILIGLLGGLIYFFRNLMLKLRYTKGSARDHQKTNNKHPLVIFSDDKRYWTVFEPICEELDKRGIGTTYLTASPDDLALESDLEHLQVEFLGDGNKVFSRMNYLSAHLVLSTTPSLDVYQWKRSKDVDYYIHLPHAASDITMYRMFGIDYYDAILLSGQYQVNQVRQLEKLRNLPSKDIALVGIPYMDRMLERLEYDLASSSTQSSTESTDTNPRRTVLLAPSWGANSILQRYGTRILHALVDTGYHIIVRPHPQSYTSEIDMLQKLQREFPATELFEWNQDKDNYEVLKRADIMLSDFSGVIFDFALVFDKPVLYADTQFDSSPYDCWWLEDSLWTFEALPRLGQKLQASDFPNIKAIIDTCIDDPHYRLERDALRAETWVQPGEGASRVVDFIEEQLQTQEVGDGHVHLEYSRQLNH